MVVAMMDFDFPNTRAARVRAAALWCAVGTQGVQRWGGGDALCLSPPHHPRLVLPGMERMRV